MYADLSSKRGITGPYLRGADNENKEKSKPFNADIKPFQPTSFQDIVIDKNKNDYVLDKSHHVRFKEDGSNRLAANDPAILNVENGRGILNPTLEINPNINENTSIANRILNNISDSRVESREQASPRADQYERSGSFYKEPSASKENKQGTIFSHPNTYYLPQLSSQTASNNLSSKSSLDNIYSQVDPNKRIENRLTNEATNAIRNLSVNNTQPLYMNTLLNYQDPAKKDSTRSQPKSNNPNHIDPPTYGSWNDSSV
jgi:hypothetical protein